MREPWPAACSAERMPDLPVSTVGSETWAHRQRGCFISLQPCMLLASVFGCL